MHAPASRLLPMILLAAAVAAAQYATDPILIKNWAAPLYWQPPPVEASAKGGEPEVLQAAITAPLVFVGVTPCRIVDTRVGQGQIGNFGPPTLAAGSTRSVPVPTHPVCGIPPAAKAYSVNVAVVPQGPLGYLTMWPAGSPQPLVATLNALDGQITANAAVVPAGTGGGVNIYVTNITDVVVDINGYYAPMEAIALAPGAASAPALSFGSNTGTGIYSSSPGTLNFASGGFNRLELRADGDLDLPGSIRKSGTLFLHSRGDDNVGIGLRALAANSTGIQNAAFGSCALCDNTAGNRNTAAGRYALTSNATGSENTAVGTDAMFANFDGNGNVAVGAQALNGAGSGHLNTAVGVRSLFFNVNGQRNAALGSGALYFATGSNNIGLGYEGGRALGTGSDNIMIGNAGDGADAATIRIGAVQTRAFISGVRGATTGGAGAIAVLIDADGQLGTVSSSRRAKEDIQDMTEASSGLFELRPVTFRYKQPYADGSQPLDYGLIAEEVAEVFPDLVARNRHGEVESVQYHKLVPMLLNELQKQRRQVQLLEERLRALESGR